MTVLVLFGIYIRKHLFSVCLSVQWAFLFFWLNWGSAHALISATKWFEIEIPGHDRLSGITKIVINLNWHLHHTHTRSQRRFRSIFTIVNESTKSTVKTSNGNCCFVCAKCNSPVRASRTRPTFTSAPKNRKTTNKNNDEMCAFCVFVEPLLSLMSWINFGELCFVYAPRASARRMWPRYLHISHEQKREIGKKQNTHNIFVFVIVLAWDCVVWPSLSFAHESDPFNDYYTVWRPSAHFRSVFIWILPHTLIATASARHARRLSTQNTRRGAKQRKKHYPNILHPLSVDL